MEKIIKIFLGGFTSPKTTVVALLGAIAYLVNHFYGWQFTGADQQVIAAAVIVIIGWLAKDADKSGTVYNTSSDVGGGEPQDN